MGLFGNPRKKIEKWAPIVMEGYVPGMPVEEEFLDAATSFMLESFTTAFDLYVHLIIGRRNRNGMSLLVRNMELCLRSGNMQIKSRSRL